MNLKDGIGKMVYADGSSYHGYFVSGHRCGEGIFHYSNQDRYSGAWKRGKKHGYGTYIINSENIKVSTLYLSKF